MPAIQTFTRGMIEKYLKANNWNYSTDSDGDFGVTFLHHEERDCQVTCWFICQDIHDSGRYVAGYQYQVVATPDKQLPRSEWGRVLLALNVYMQKFPWLKAYLDVGDYDNDASAVIRLKQWDDFSQGVSQEHLDAFSDRLVNSSLHFCRWAHQDRGLW